MPQEGSSQPKRRRRLRSRSRNQSASPGSDSEGPSNVKESSNCRKNSVKAGPLKSHSEKVLISIKDSSGDLSDSDFEPKSSQRLKPRLQKKRKSKDKDPPNETSRRDMDEAGPSHGGAIKVKSECSASGNSTPKPQWVLLDSHAEDIAGIAGVLDEQIAKFKQRYLEYSWEENMLPLAVTELQRFIKRGVQSLCDVAEDLRSLSTSSGLQPIKAEISSDEAKKELALNEEKKINGKSTSDTIECCESNSNDESSPKAKRTRRCGSTDSDRAASPGVSTKIQRCGSTESVATVGSPKAGLCDSDTQEGQTEPEELTSAAAMNPNTSCDMFSDLDLPEQSIPENGENSPSDVNHKKPSDIAQSIKSLDCKANLMADSDSDSESDSREVGTVFNGTASSGSDSDEQISSPRNSVKRKPKKSTFNIEDLDVYHSDIKLQGKCSVKISKLPEADEKKYIQSIGSYYDVNTSEDSNDDNSVKNLVNLKNLQTKGKGSDSESGTSSVKSCKEKKEVAKDKSKNKEKLADYMNKTDISEGEHSFEKLQPDCNSTLQDTANINDAHKKLLLESSDSENEQADDESQEMSKVDKRSESGNEESPPTVSDAIETGNVQGDDAKSDDAKSDDAKSDADKSDKESDVETKSESKKKSWRNNRLLTAKLSDTDTSDEEKRWEKRKMKLKDENNSSDDENIQPKKRKTKESPKKKDSDIEVISDDQQSSSSEDFIKKKPRRTVKKSSSSSSSEEEKPKKKRRRIKVQNSSSDDEEESKIKDAESPTKGRKKIRHVISEEDLEKGTKEAAKEEEERLKRIASRQKMYEELYENVQKGFHVLDSLVLDFDEKTKEPLVEVDKALVKKLKPHQAKGVKFMWDACFESLKRIRSSNGSGCILAHCMGLGKTFQVVTLVHTLFKFRETKVERVLVVCPVSTVLNWVNEFHKWLDSIRDGPDVEVFEMTRCKQNMERSYKLREWVESGGVMVIGYDMYRNITNPESKRVRGSLMKTFQTALVNPGPDLVICDEGHLLKNEETGTSKALTRIKTLRRVILTGTPLQNNLKEYHCMVQFVKPNLLGTRKEFLNRFVNPITNGQFEDSTSHDVKRMKRRAHVLHKTLEGCVQRFDYSVLTPYLPTKEEYVILVRVTDTQEKLYRHYLEFKSARGQAGKGAQLFADFQQLQRVWTHPRVLKMSQERNELKAEKEDATDSEGSLRDFIDDGSGSDSSSSSSSSEEDDDDVVCLSGGETKKKKAPPARRTRSNKDVSPEPEAIEPPPKEVEWWQPFVQDSDFEDIRASPKMQLLFSILKECEENGEKLLVFSQSLFSLDVIEYFLGKIDEATQKGVEDEALDGHRGSWSLGIDYFRLDGSTPTDLRSTWCNVFNRPSNLRARLFLISTRAGGLGINLVAANRVVIFDASWNPSHDVQSIFRIYRFGQTKPCYIYRFLAQGTMEEKIYERQVTKLSLACRVVDELQVERYYKMADLQELYMFTPADRDSFVAPKLPKDHLFAELLKKYKSTITSYHEHDSLLENKEEEELNESERQAAWEDYENEKKGPIMQQPVVPELPSLDQIKETLRLREPMRPDEELEQMALAAYRRIVEFQQQQQQQAIQRQQAQQAQQLLLRQQQYQQQQQQMQYLRMQEQLMQQQGYAAQQYPYQYGQQQPYLNARAPAPNLASTSMPSHSRQGYVQQPAILKKPPQVPSNSHQK
ncbi:transcriptional regulator ATRX homolog isoform X2 [Thrips palmi]|uniref:Transcriptional regulator ATRX homolog isoform X2 n=1 Tax=Thrips palmi TaxID=161013 RepID=A0A6P8YX29_THRPL|nr:transcriptional regulator ATRX homolog isoform X2 [Thrips palmi]